jgi:hypothetical protein
MNLGDHAIGQRIAFLAQRIQDLFRIVHNRSP